jgi:hypothetical protein
MTESLVYAACIDGPAQSWTVPRELYEWCQIRMVPQICRKSTRLPESNKGFAGAKLLGEGDGLRLTLVQERSETSTHAVMEDGC